MATADASAEQGMDAPARPSMRSNVRLAVGSVLLMAAVMCGVMLNQIENGFDWNVVGLLGLSSSPKDSSFFPSWTHGGALRYYDRSMAHGQWSPDAGPPYVKHVTMWSDPDCVDHTGPANNVRRILGLRTSWHDHKWNTNSFMSDMNSVQLRFLSRNTNSVLVIPPFHQFPSMSTRAMAMLNDYVLVGGNTIIVVGGPTGVLFINQNLAGTDGYGYELEPKWVEGPYEMQDSAMGSAFQYGAVTLPAVETYNVGVTTASLPKEAVSYYEASEVSVVFMLPCEAGRIIYIGYTFAEMVPAWTDILLLALRSSPT